MDNNTKIKESFCMAFVCVTILVSCSHQQITPGGSQIIPSISPDMHAKAIIAYDNVPRPFRLPNLLGPADFPAGGSYFEATLGDGWVIVDMGKDHEIIDLPGPDLRIYETDENYDPTLKAISELYLVYVSNDLLNWHSLGYGKGITEFDIGPTGLREARYVKIQGFTEGNKSQTAGPDIEAIEGLHVKSNTQTNFSANISNKDAPVEASITKSSNIEPQFGNYFALVIANDEYEYLPRLKTAVSDGAVITEILQKKYGFKVETLTNAKREDILRKLNQFRRDLKHSDNLLIYYAGHGWLDEVGDEGYWLPIDAEKNIETNWISNSHITTTLRAMAANHVIVIADSCYSGKLTRGINIMDNSSEYFARMVQRKSRTVLSSGGLEPVLDSGGKGNHSVFASAFIDTLNENQEITDATQIFSKVRKTVMLNSHQLPEYGDIRLAGHDGGDFLFVPFSFQK